MVKNQYYSIPLRIVGTIIFGILLLSACTTRQTITQANNPHPTSKDSLAHELALLSAFNDQYQEWRGVPYRYGGMEKSGIDCSGFVHLTYRNKLKLQIPRSTATLSTLGVEVPRADLKTGDLVFFKTGRQRHVGIYLNDQQFLHASRSKGVTISNLQNRYWEKTYWKAIRVPDINSAITQKI